MKNTETRTTVKTECAVFAMVKSSGKFRPISMNRYSTPENAWEAHEAWVKDWGMYDCIFDLTTAEVRCRTVIITETEWETVQAKDGE